MKWVLVVSIAVILVLLYLVWHNSGLVAKIESDVAIHVKTNDSLKLFLKSQDSTDKAMMVAVTFHDSITGRKLDSALHIIGLQKDSLKTAKNQLTVAVDNLGDAIDASLDTSLIHKFDSVKTRLSEAYNIVQDYSTNNDQIVKLLDSSLTYKDSIIVIQATEIRDLKKSLTVSLTNFDGLNKDTQALASKIKRQSLFTKIGTTLGIVAGFLLGHSIK